jgi:small subunit ribosomal protein S20
MANHKSALKRIRQSEKKRIINRYYHKTARTALRVLRSEEDKSAATLKLPSVISLLDKLVKKNIIHKNKAANLKSKLTKHVNKLA